MSMTHIPDTAFSPPIGFMESTFWAIIVCIPEKRRMIANVTIGRKIGGRNRYRFLISTKIINLVRKKSLNLNSAGIFALFVEIR